VIHDHVIILPHTEKLPFEQAMKQRNAAKCGSDFII